MYEMNIPRAMEKAPAKKIAKKPAPDEDDDLPYESEYEYEYEFDDWDTICPPEIQIERP